MTKTLGMLTAMILLVVPPAAADVSNANHYSNQTPYGNAATSEIAVPPAGYSIDFLETVGRHGARSLTKDDAEVRALALWEQARRKGKLTTVGKRFKTDLRSFQAAEKKLGYGNLSGVGADEWRGIGRRTAENYSDLFDAAESSGDEVLFTTTSVQRTKDSAAAMRLSLDNTFPDLDTDSTTVDSRMLIDSGSTKQGRAAIAKAFGTSAAKAKAKHLLGRLYTSDFVAKIKQPVHAAQDIYLLYCTAPGLADESDVTFASYVPLADAPAMAQLKDTQNFYRYGPGYTGQRDTFEQTDWLLDDFFDRIDQRVTNGGDVAAVFRLAHGETTMPFAARIRLAGSQKQSTAYSYGSNPWRGWVAGRLAGNIEWAVYTAKEGPALVTMRYNEQPTAFHAGCDPIAEDELFYTVTELKRCLT